ncbi:MAG: UDP-N-acetylmuramoyl-L-alanine--D-glutamate ligase [Lachnospiraceae bacterium]|nr:UDP-N-acetylmuramoyl-L-alanine--D-glutamate ligase [Lachnospiraceae bacterium]
MELKGKKILIVGAGKSGIAAAELLDKKGIAYALYDGNEKLSIETIRDKSPALQDCEIFLGTLKKEVLDTTNVVVLSPGVPTDLPVINAMRQMGLPIWGEIELAYHFAKGRLLAITGTNGKTTTTALLGEIMRAYFEDVKVVGNIGTPYTSVVDDTDEDSVTVAEISSFQLETVWNFHPQVSAILNITPDHLNRHHTMDCYIKTKESIAKNQTNCETCVLNYEDEVLREFGRELKSRVVFFSSKRPLENGFFYEDETIYRVKNGERQKIIDTSRLQILGLHNYENTMAAVAMADCFGVPMESIVDTLEHFKAVEHRIEYVVEKRGVRFYNDSKGTNPDAAIQGIRAMNRPTFLIGGGYDKESKYDEWIEAFDGKVKKLVLIGQTKEKIASCARQHGFEKIAFADSLSEAIDLCYEDAKSGDAILLSPACASWGMFDNYEQRGELFKEYAKSLKE